MFSDFGIYKVRTNLLAKIDVNNNDFGTRPKPDGFYRRMRKRSFSSLILCLSTLVAANLFVSCTTNEPTTEFSQGKDAVIRFQINADTPKDATTRSVDEDKISDLHILVYNSAGELTGKSYTTFSGTTYTVSVLARSGTGCKIYAIANTGSPTLFDGAVAGTEDKLKAMTTNLATWATFNATSGTVYLPMSGSVTTDISAGTSSLQGGITVKRLMARITLNVGVAAGSGITISGYRVYGIPGKSYYVAHPLATEEQTIDAQTTRAVDASLPANSGDWINSGLVSLANVTSFSGNFYMYENRAGVNAGITAQNQKIKANVPATPADSAAYVMIYGKGGNYSSLSWKVYLGANNTGNFNIKRNNQYTYTITLKINSLDTRVTYNPKLIWAGSNIYWDGTKLTFDAPPVDPANPTTQELTNQKKQGVFFMWGSLVGISPNGSNGSAYNSSVRLYIPSFNSTTPQSSSWDKTKTGDTMDWSTGIPYVSTNDATINLNDASQNTDVNYKAYKGDICQYLSKTGAISGSWRMPTVNEFQSSGSWSYLSGWTDLAIAGDETGMSGLTSITPGIVITATGGTARFPASGYRNNYGALRDVGQYGNYWSSSTYSETTGYFLYFSSTNVIPANGVYRQVGFSVRCVRNN
ncbi:DUF4906 domain-containing protein [Bacteroidaceae bacterium HV4-6-C5C]|nr:DUF4906 domain-containing protein [Bacteroidaceae bacterium HV4-6-C5C]